MKPIFALIALLTLTTTDLQAGAKSVSNPLFSYTHILPSPYTMPAGKIYIGTELAIGITDFMEIGTSIIRNFYQTYNAQVKLQLVDSASFATGITGSWVSYALGTQQVTIWSPGVVTAFGLAESLAWYLGGNMNFTNITINYSGVTTSSIQRGTAINSDLAWTYSRKSSKKGNSTIGNVLAAGVTYDLDYRMLGIGLSHYWNGLRIGFHYYPTASTYPVYPIISGSTVVDF